MYSTIGGLQMDDKPQVSAKKTYVLDADEVERLDELSLTSVIGDAADFVDGPRDQPRRDAPAIEQPASLSDATINELLGEPPACGTPHFDRENSHHGIPEHVEPPDDLIAPELLFPGRTGDD
jgi:hypothetical protein